MLLALEVAAAFAPIVVGIALRQRRRTADHAEPSSHVVGAAA